MSLLLTFGKKSVIQRAISVLRKFGTNAHAYIPGVGVLNGMTAGNYTDTAGTQLTTKDQFVGLDLDAMGSLGAELVTNGGFDTDTGWTKNSGWTISGGKANATTTSNDQLFTALSISPGKTYLVTFDVISYTSGTPWVWLGQGVSTPFSTTPGAKRYYLAAGSGDTLIRFGAAFSVGWTGSIDNISVKEVTGIRATQGTAGNKPVLRQGPVNLLLNSATLSTQSVAVAASPHTLSFTGTGTVTKSGTATGALVGTGATDRVTQTFTPTAGTLTLTVTGSVTSAQLQLGLAATTYIPTTSAKASAGTGPSYWEFGGDGTPTDYLGLGSVPFQMSDDGWVVAAVQCVSKSAGNRILHVGSSATDTQRVACLTVNATTGFLSAIWRDDASAVVTLVDTVDHVSNGVFVGSCRKSGASLSLRVNGVQVASAAQTFGATTLNAAAIGVHTATGSNFNGNIYAVLCGKGAITDTDLLLIEKLAANLAGITI